MADKDYQDFSNLPIFIPKRLKAVKLTVEQLAHRSGVSRTSVYRYLYDQDRPSEKTALLMSKALEVPFEEMLGQYVPKKRGPRGGTKDTTKEVTVRKSRKE